jgi:ABC-type transport system involved in cytochrome c biogenesis ATPase subunit
MEPLLEARGLWKRFGALEAVKGVNLTLAPGEIQAFLGKNGAGKTTTVKMLSSLLFPDEGEVRLLGQDPFKEPSSLRHLGAVLEGNRNVYWRLTPLENLVYFGVARGLSLGAARRRSQALLEEYGLLEKARVEVRHLSRGMQQKLALLQALIHDPRGPPPGRAHPGSGRGDCPPHGGQGAGTGPKGQGHPPHHPPALRGRGPGPPGGHHPPGGDRAGGGEGGPPRPLRRGALRAGAGGPPAPRGPEAPQGPGGGGRRPLSLPGGWDGPLGYPRSPAAPSLSSGWPRRRRTFWRSS